MLATLPMVFKRGSRRLRRFVITKERSFFERRQEARAINCGRVFDRSGTLRTTREGKSPVESGIPVPTLGINSDTETGSPVLNKRVASSPERGRSG